MEMARQMSSVRVVVVEMQRVVEMMREMRRVVGFVREMKVGCRDGEGDEKDCGD